MHAFLWQKGTMRDLGVSNKLGIDVYPEDINERGQILGYVFERHAFLWQNGRMRDLGTLGGPRSLKWGGGAINDRGQVVGDADTKAKDGSGDPFSHAFFWQSGKMRDLGTLGGPDSSAVAINDRGQIIGYTETNSCYNGCPRAILWTYQP